MNAGKPSVALFCLLAAALAHGAPQPDEKVAFHGPDGVLYDNEESFKLMQMDSSSGNLLGNGSFELGRYWPSGWQATDGLSTFWVEGGTDGKRCMKVFTNVLDDQWSAHEKKVRAAVDAVRASGRDPQKLPRSPLPPTPPRRPTRPPYYDTVGGLHGVHYRSEYVRCKPGAIYRFSVDARNDGRGEPRVFIKGFFDQKMKTGKGVEVVRRNAYRAPMILDPCGEEWCRYVRLFHPSRSQSTLGKKPLATEFLQVQLYAYWPVGDYYFDNVRLDIVGIEGEVEPQPEPQDEDENEDQPELGEDEFPVFGD